VPLKVDKLHIYKYGYDDVDPAVSEIFCNNFAQWDNNVNCLAGTVREFYPDRPRRQLSKKIS